MTPHPICKNIECCNVKLVIVTDEAETGVCPTCAIVYQLQPIKSNPETIEKEHQRMKAYEKAINKIDDFFEYANDSLKDRKFVHSILDDLSKRLVTIYK